MVLVWAAGRHHVDTRWRAVSNIHGRNSVRNLGNVPIAYVLCKLGSLGGRLPDIVFWLCSSPRLGRLVMGGYLPEE